MALTADTVAELLLGGQHTRSAALDALEASAAPIEAAVALAAAKPLVELQALPSSTVGRDEFNRISLLMHRLFDEGCADPVELWVAAYAEGRYANLVKAEDNVIAEAVLHKDPAEITIEDARCIAYATSEWTVFGTGGMTRTVGPAGLTCKQWLSIWKQKPLVSA